MKQYALLVLWGLPMICMGQGDIFSLTLRADYGRFTQPENDLNDFYRSYNEYYSSVLPAPFDTISHTEFSHPNVGAGIRYFTGEKVGFTSGLFMTYGRSRFSQQSVFRSNLTTETKFETRDWTLQYDLGIHIRRFLLIQGHLGGTFRKTVLDLGYIYQDGSYSIGNEYDILGVYIARTNTLDMGASVTLKLGRVLIPVSMTWPTPWISDDNLLTLVDFDKRQIRWKDLPRDFETWADDPPNIDLDNGFVRARSLRFTRFTVGLELMLTGNRS